MALQPRIPRTVPGKSVAKAEERKTREARFHVEIVKTLPCCATGKAGLSDAHHLMRGVERGMGLTAAGRYVIPLCRAVHDEIQPNGDPEAVLMARYGVAARELADALWAASPDVGAMLRVVVRHHQDAQRRRQG
jgi:hypothetical protein